MIHDVIQQLYHLLHVGMLWLKYGSIRMNIRGDGDEYVNIYGSLCENLYIHKYVLCVKYVK
jgi:hypothetical protein